MIFCYKIKTARMALGMKQTELAQAVGCSHSTISGWENQARIPTVSFIPKLAKTLKIPAMELVEAMLEQIANEDLK